MNRFLLKTISAVAAAAILTCQIGTVNFKNIITTNPIQANATIKYTDDYDEFLDALGAAESGNNYTLSGRGYYGRWMIGTLGLQEAGLMTSSGSWTKLAASYGVYNATDFCNSEACQDYAILVLHKRNWEYLKSNGAASHLGETYRGVKVTVAGLIGAAHLVGAWGVKSMFNGGNAVDGNGVSAFSYMKRFGGYNIDKTITGVDTVVHNDPAPAPTTTAAPTTEATTTITTTTTTVTTEAPTEEPTQAPIEFDKITMDKYGDVDGDSTVNAADATYILIYYAEHMMDTNLTFEDFMNARLADVDDPETETDTTDINTESKETTTETSEDTTVTQDPTEATTTLSTDITDATVDIKINAAAEDPTETTTSETTAEATTETELIEPTENSLYSIGDVNGDGVIDAADATLILIYYANVLNGIN